MIAMYDYDTNEPGDMCLKKVCSSLFWSFSSFHTFVRMRRSVCVHSCKCV